MCIVVACSFSLENSTQKDRPTCLLLKLIDNTEQTKRFVCLLQAHRCQKQERQNDSALTAGNAQRSQYVVPDYRTAKILFNHTAGCIDENERLALLSRMIASFFLLEKVYA